MEIAANDKIQRTLSHILSISESWVGSDLEHLHRDTKLWPVSPASAALLEGIILLNNCQSILELGTSSGFSTIHFARAALKTVGHVFTIEHDKQKVKLAHEHFESAGLKSYITLIEGDILEALKYPSLPAVVDFVFIDAEKANYHRYYEEILPKLKPGAFIIADNVKSHARQVAQYVSSVQANCNLVNFFWEFDAGLLISRLKN